MNSRENIRMGDYNITVIIMDGANTTPNPQIHAAIETATGRKFTLYEDAETYRDNPYASTIEIMATPGIETPYINIKRTETIPRIDDTFITLSPDICNLIDTQGMMYESNVIILVTQTVFGIEQMMGLMFGRLLPSNRFYIEVVCGLQDGVRYVGTLMMTITEAFTKAVGVDRISLNSLNDTVGFYEKLGYAPHTRKERYDGMVAMIKKMGGGRRKTRRAIRKSRRRRTIK